ncbi:binding-protein-dependent transport system inner membrane component family protein [Asticcacaulis biprosthecium C19]|uniref:Binding-protein-dependent transport system inner membrane component family protein n=1 Tax=Asticcacaulis biprosthecium C19 TaxID=715226 RepID=F4QRQ2_9CAUL|nr:methionine ABC transporter permease [Asticcacaulis biprosthecium]EGF89422.1 binding-protein-dependent transport system inner membrane component family protein [Asticcacaulis biprosthecium C19]
MNDVLQFFSNIDPVEIALASWETVAMLLGSLVLSVGLGLPLGVWLSVTSPTGLAPNRLTYGLLSFVVNVLRSIPFVILFILLIPVTLALVGTSLGVRGAIPPLVLGAAPFFARLVETALREVDRSVVEATQALGASKRQIVLHTLVPEAMPGLVAAVTVTAIALVSYTAMAGVVGAGGLGDLAVRYGYQRFQTDVMVVTVALIIVLVQGLQMFGDALVARFHKR